MYKYEKAASITGKFRDACDKIAPVNVDFSKAFEDSVKASPTIYFLVQALTIRDELKETFLKGCTEAKYQELRKTFEDNMKTIKTKYTYVTGQDDLTKAPATLAPEQRIKDATQTYLSGLDEAWKTYTDYMKKYPAPAPAASTATPPSWAPAGG